MLLIFCFYLHHTPLLGDGYSSPRQSEYAVEDKAILKHPAYESRLVTIKDKMKNLDGTFKKDAEDNPYTAHDYGMAVEQAKAVTATEMQTRLTAHPFLWWGR